MHLRTKNQGDSTDWRAGVKTGRRHPGSSLAIFFLSKNNGKLLSFGRNVWVCGVEGSGQGNDLV